MRLSGLGGADWLRVGTLSGYLLTVLLIAWLLLTTEPVEGQIPPGGGLVFLAVAGLAVVGAGVHTVAVAIAVVVERWRGPLHRAQRVEGGLAAAALLGVLLLLLSDIVELRAVASMSTAITGVALVALPFATLNVLRVSRKRGG